MTVEVQEGIRLTITREFAAAPDRVYRAFVDESIAAAWMWGGMGMNPRAHIDLRVGGRYLIAIDEPDDRSWPTDERSMEGVYVEIVPDRRLVYTLRWNANVGYNVDGQAVLDEAVIVDLAPSDNGTTMTFQHIGIPADGVSAQRHAEGIDASFDLLENLLRG